MTATTFKPIEITVVAHRGASGYRPEHTESAYRLAVAQGADFIEPDLVLSKDGHLVVRHENELSGTTNVADLPQFQNRETTKRVDGVQVSGWFSEDFTLAELKTLKAKERIPELRPHNQDYDLQEPILTLEEVIALAKDLELEYQRPIGIYPETKHPTYFKYTGEYLDGGNIGMCISTKLVQVLSEQSFLDPRRVFIQSFEIQNLIELKTQLLPPFEATGIPLVQLLGNLSLPDDSLQKAFSQPYDVVYNIQQGNDLAKIYGSLAHNMDENFHYGLLTSKLSLESIQDSYAAAIGPWKTSLYSDTGITLMEHARGAGLGIHPYTLRLEKRFQGGPDSESPLSFEGEVVWLLDHGATGFFTDFPDLGVKYAHEWQRNRGD